jgi:hypothetical protein
MTARDRDDETPSERIDDDSAHVERTTAKDPDDWVTGDEPMTGAQASYLETLCREAGEEPPDRTMTKAEASRRIDELQERTGRGK